MNAASDAAKAVTLSDEDVAAMAREYIQWMDTHNEVAGPETEMGQRLANLTKDIKVEGLDLNFKVYNVIDGMRLLVEMAVCLWRLDEDYG